MCFNMVWFENILIWLVIIGAVVAIFKLLLPLVFNQLGVAGAVILRIINIIVWAIVLIFIIIFAFDLISCLSGSNFKFNFKFLR